MHWAVGVGAPVLTAAKLLGDVRPIAFGITLPKLAIYLLLSVPIILFIVSLYVPPTMIPDSGVGFFVLRHMLEGGAFNTFTTPDASNIAEDTVIFLTWWTPGQYLVPGAFVWLGVNYGLALSLTSLVATVIGIVGWIQLARSFGVSPAVLFLFALGLTTFSYVTVPFRTYHGGELLLFAVAPWSLYVMSCVLTRPPILCFAISFLFGVLLFLAKLTGVIVFASNVAALSVLTLVSQRRLSSSLIAMWVGSAIGASCFVFFWLGHGPVPAGGTTFVWLGPGPVSAGGTTFAFSWFPIWFSVTGATFSGISGVDFLSRLLGHPLVGILVGESGTQLLSKILGPLGLVLMIWVWFQLRHTRHRDMAVLLLAIIVLYTIAVATMYLRGASVDFEERHFRYAGILFFLLLLTAVDRWHKIWAKGWVCAVVVVLGLYGLKQFFTGAYAHMRSGYYDPFTGITQEVVSPRVLQYLHSEMIQHNYRRPIVVIPSSSAAISLPRFGIFYIPDLSTEDIVARKFAGRAEKIFVVIQEEMRLNGKAEAILRSFTGYAFENWTEMKLDGMVIYTQ
jgi:hypothetical protein